MKWRGVALWATFSALAAGCATAPPVAPPIEERPAPSAPSPVQMLEGPHRARALNLMQERRWAEAAIQWELLLLLRPQSSEYRALLATTRKHIEDTAHDALGDAEQARKRGDLDAAATQYLRALNADRDNQGAANGLREIERERVRRAYLNRSPRGMTGAMTPTAEDLAEVDEGVSLYRQGDYVGAVQSLQRYLPTHPKDTVARGYLADAFYQLGLAAVKDGRKEDALRYFEKGRAVSQTDRNGLEVVVRETRRSLADDYFRRGVEAYAQNPRQAIELWQQSLRYDPSHEEALARLRSARQAARSAGAAAARQ